MKLNPRQRLIRLTGGVAFVVLGSVIYSISKSNDPKNRGALVAIIVSLVGITWLGQAIRGRTEGVTTTEEPVLSYPPISAERTVAGILCAWLVPGLGHWIVGRRGKAILLFCAITTTFVIGAFLGHGRVFNYDRDGVYYLAYMFCALPTGIAWLVAGTWELDHNVPHLQLGFLYTSVACLLNLVVIMDFLSTCTMSGKGPALPDADDETDSAGNSSASRDEDGWNGPQSDYVDRTDRKDRKDSERELDDGRDDATTDGTTDGKTDGDDGWDTDPKREGVS